MAKANKKDSKKRAEKAKKAEAKSLKKHAKLVKKAKAARPFIAHVSIPARDPRYVAEQLAPIIDAEVYHFPVVPGAYVCVARDGSGVALEILPERSRQLQGVGEPDPNATIGGPKPQPWEVQIPQDGLVPGPMAVHMAITTLLEPAEVLEIGRRTGWRAVACDRAGVFGLVELWVDNRFLIEVLPQAEAVRYRKFMRPEGCGELFGPPSATPKAAA